MLGSHFLGACDSSEGLCHPSTRRRLTAEKLTGPCTRPARFTDFSLSPGKLEMVFVAGVTRDAAGLRHVSSAECKGSAHRSARIFYAIDTIILPFDLSIILICWGCFMKTTLPRQDISSNPFLLSKSSELSEATISLNAPQVLGTPTALMYLATDWLL